MPKKRYNPIIKGTRNVDDIKKAPKDSIIHMVKK